MPSREEANQHIVFKLDLTTICCANGRTDMKTQNTLVQMREDIFKKNQPHMAPSYDISCETLGSFPGSYMFQQNTIPVVCTNGTILRSLPGLSGKTESFPS